MGIIFFVLVCKVFVEAHARVACLTVAEIPRIAWRVAKCLSWGG